MFWCFVLTVLPYKIEVLRRRRSDLFCFALPISFCALNAIRREQNFDSRERFFIVSLFASKGNPADEGKEFRTAERTVKVCSLHSGLKDLRKSVSDRI